LTTVATPGRKPRLPARLIAVGLVASMACLPASTAVAQEAEHAQEAHGEHEGSPGFRHYVTLSGGAATHTENNDTGGAVGLSYAYSLSHRWAVGIKLEYADSEVERDRVALLGFVYEPVERVEFGAALGVERADVDEVDHGEEHTVSETEALVRLTFAYLIPLSERWHLGPEFNADITASRVTYVYGLFLSLGL
jgi:hypothetical protein